MDKKHGSFSMPLIDGAEKRVETAFISADETTEIHVTTSDMTRRKRTRRGRRRRRTRWRTSKGVLVFEGNKVWTVLVNVS